MKADDLKEILSEISHLTVLTGAGISAPSGIATFRPNNEVATVNGYSVEDISSARMWKKKPDVTWAFYMDKLSAMRDAAPNAAHHALAHLQKRRTVEIFTQNMDDFHEQAGSERVEHFHGAAHRFVCTFCDEPIDASTIDYSSTTCAWHDCGYRIRPEITLFGEPMPPVPVKRIEEILNRKRTELLLVVGTSLNVSPVNMFPLLAMDKSIPVYEINVIPSQFSDMFTGFIRGSADRVLPHVAGMPQT